MRKGVVMRMNKRTLCLSTLTLVLLLTAVGMASALPRTYKEFKSRYQQEGKTPEGAVRLYFEAVFCYMNPSLRDEAGKMLRYSLYLDRPIEQYSVHKTFLDRLRDPNMAYIFKSYAVGATPENGYQMSPDNFELEFTRKAEESDYLRLFLRNGGADSPRAVWVKEYDGLWYVINNCNTYLQVRPPKSNAKKTSHDADFD